MSVWFKRQEHNHYSKLGNKIIVVITSRCVITCVASRNFFVRTMCCSVSQYAFCMIFEGFFFFFTKIFFTSAAWHPQEIGRFKLPHNFIIPLSAQRDSLTHSDVMLVAGSPSLCQVFIHSLSKEHLLCFPDTNYVSVCYQNS